MADVSISSATLVDGTLTIAGAGFTKTTTIVEIDGNETLFTWVSETEITVSDVADDARDVDVTKSGITASTTITTEEAMGDPETTETVTEGPAGGTAGAGTPAPITAEDVKTEQIKGPPDPVSEPVEPKKATIMTLGPREPYPLGDPPVPPKEESADRGG